MDAKGKSSNRSNSNTSCSLIGALLQCVKQECYWPALSACLVNVGALLRDAHVLLSNDQAVNQLALCLLHLCTNKRVTSLVAAPTEYVLLILGIIIVAMHVMCT